VNRYEKQKAAIERGMAEHVEAYQAIYKSAEKDDRDPTDDERLEIEGHLKAIETLKKERHEADENIKTLQRVDDLGRELGPAVSPLSQASVGAEPQDRYFQTMQQANKSLGDAFIESAGYKRAIEQYRESGRLESGFSTGPVALEMKGTLLEGASSPGSGSGGGLLTVPQVVPGPVHVRADLRQHDPVRGRRYGHLGRRGRG
jgi:hypothetical protein